jgi:hypothetical protein
MMGCLCSVQNTILEGEKASGRGLVMKLEGGYCRREEWVEVGGEPLVVADVLAHDMTAPPPKQLHHP